MGTEHIYNLLKGRTVYPNVINENFQAKFAERFPHRETAEWPIELQGRYPVPEVAMLGPVRAHNAEGDGQHFYGDEHPGDLARQDWA